MGDMRVWLECDPPEPCEVSIAAAFPNLGHGGSWRADRVPMYLRANGLRLEFVMPGELEVWARMVDASWIARVCLRPTVQRQRVAMRTWVTSDAVSIDPPVEE